MGIDAGYALETLLVATAEEASEQFFCKEQLIFRVGWDFLEKMWPGFYCRDFVRKFYEVYFNNSLFDA